MTDSTGAASDRPGSERPADTAAALPLDTGFLIVPRTLPADELRAGLSPAGRSALETFLIESAELTVPTQPVDSARAVGSADPSSGS